MFVHRGHTHYFLSTRDYIGKQCLKFEQGLNKLTFNLNKPCLIKIIEDE